MTNTFVPCIPSYQLHQADDSGVQIGIIGYIWPKTWYDQKSAKHKLDVNVLTE